MKKNISINLFGQLYAIDEDAYQMLECYLDSMKKYFSRQEGGEEIADDIEHRVAELLWERREQGAEAVDLETVKAIIKQIGNPDEIDDNENKTEKADNGDAAGTPGEDLGETLKKGMYAAGKATKSAFGKAKEHISHRRFYLDNRDRILGGVCSGLAQYFGGSDPLLWRVATVLLAFISMGFTVILYLLIWMVAPEARTPEERLRMQGKEVNGANLGEQILNDSKEETTPKHNIFGKIVRTILWFFGAIVMIFVVFPFLIFTPLIAVLIFALVAVGLNMGESLMSIPTQDLWMLEFYQNHWGTAFTALVCGLIVGIIPLYSFVRMMRRDPDKRMAGSTKMTLFFIWFFALVIGLCCCGLLGYNWEMVERLHW